MQLLPEGPKTTEIWMFRLHPVEVAAGSEDASDEDAEQPQSLRLFLAKDAYNLAGLPDVKAFDAFKKVSSCSALSCHVLLPYQPKAMP